MHGVTSAIHNNFLGCCGNMIRFLGGGGKPLCYETIICTRVASLSDRGKHTNYHYGPVHCLNFRVWLFLKVRLAFLVPGNLATLILLFKDPRIEHFLREMPHILVPC